MGNRITSFKQGRGRKKEKEEVDYINALPDFILGQIFRGLSVTERLRCKRVCRRWNKKTVTELGWSGQRNLDYQAVFEGAERVRKREFTNESLVALFEQIGKHLIELDLFSFINNNYVDNYRYVHEFSIFFNFCGLPITAEVCGSLHLLPNLRRIDITRLKLPGIVPFLPFNLREIHTNGPLDDASLSALALACPNLEAIFLNCKDQQTAVTVLNNLRSNQPRVQKLHLRSTLLDGCGGTSTSISDLEPVEEEEIVLWRFAAAAASFDDATFEAMIDGAEMEQCIRLPNYRKNIPLTGHTYLNLGKLTNRVEIVVLPNDEAEAMFPNLKKISIEWCYDIIAGNHAIFSLVKEFKPLVELLFSGWAPSGDNTAKELKAVVAKMSPKTPPKGSPDGKKDIFCFECELNW